MLPLQCGDEQVRGLRPRRGGLARRRSGEPGGYSWTLGYDVAFALLPVDLTRPGTELEVPILGERRKARVIADSPYDPEGLRGRM